MKTYRRLQATLFFFCLAYLVIGYFDFYLNQTEPFPVYSWDLFSYVPDDVGQDFGLRVMAVEGEAVEPLLYLEEMGLFASESQSITAYNSIQNLGWALERGDEAAVERLRSEVEQLYLGETAVLEYEITVRTYNFYERWETGRFLSEEPLARFQREGADS